MLDQYSLCPCGSGKKFKWCCQPIHVEIQKAFEQDAAGQHESGLRIMDEVTAQHPDNPEAWGKKALLLWQNEKPDEAEAALTRAFEINPDYPFGNFLRGRFRLFEGEIAGALLLFRKAAELYDPSANQLLLEIFLNIFECEMKLNRPVAARAAAMLALKADPNNLQLREAVDGIFSDNNPNLPRAATREYTYIPTKKIGRAAWDKAMARINTSRLTDVLRAFGELAKADPEDPYVWHNLGLTHAWLGNNLAAIDAFNKYLTLETDEALAVQTATLMEVLRFGQGMEDHSDAVEHSVTTQLRNPQAFVDGVLELEKAGRIAGIQVDQQNGILVGFAIDEPATSLLGAESAVSPPGIAGFFMLMGNILRVWNIDHDRLQRAVRLFREKLGPVFGESFESRGPAKFQDIITPALIVPARTISQEQHDNLVKDQIARYFEDTWIHRPLKSLGGVPPVDAVGSPVLRRKVLGAIVLIEQVARFSQLSATYDFQRLRRKLGLDSAGDAASGSPAATGSTPTVDISSLGVAELSALSTDALEPAQLESAYQAALSLDAKEVAGKFAQALVDGPSRPERSDRYPWHNHLINLALAEQNFQDAIDRINAGEKDDCENNEGRRRNDFELRRAQVQARKGDHDEAEQTFARLIDRVPNEWKYRGAATEAFLSARQGPRAMRFAEKALDEARKTNNRDQEGYFQELLEAARRQG